MAPRRIGGIVAAGIGAVWFAQGVGVLPGSYMTGRGEYAVLGAILIVVGLALLGWSFRPPPDDL